MQTHPKVKSMFRQGDLLLVRVVLPVSKEYKLVKSGVLQYGEATGHSHRIEGGEVYELGDSRYVVVHDDAKLVHEEHHTINLPEGNYRVIRQREYDEEMIRYVSD